MEFYERLEELRKNKGVSQFELEKALGFSNGLYCKWKKSMPASDKCKKLADYFGVSVEYLCAGKDVEFSQQTALLDYELTSQNERIKEYMLKFAKLPTNVQEHIIDLIDMFDNKDK